MSELRRLETFDSRWAVESEEGSNQTGRRRRARKKRRTRKTRKAKTWSRKATRREDSQKVRLNYLHGHGRHFLTKRRQRGK